MGLRPLTVYGPGRDAGLTSFPTRAIASVIMGKEFEIPFSGPTVYTHIEEVRAAGTRERAIAHSYPSPLCHPPTPLPIHTRALSPPPPPTPPPRAPPPPRWPTFS